jgi:hypothetical protein
VQLDPRTNGRACTICRLPFEVSVFPGLEGTEGIPRIPLFIIQYSSVVNAVISYGLLRWTLPYPVENWSEAVWQISRDGALASHAIYAICLWFYWRVQDRQAYARFVLRSRIPGMLTAHAYALYGILVAPVASDYMAVVLMHLLLKMYWVEHCTVLTRINERLVRD